MIMFINGHAVYIDNILFFVGPVFEWALHSQQKFGA